MDVHIGYYQQALYGNDVKDQKIKRLEKEIEQLRKALKETLAVARRNEIGDYIQRAEVVLQQKDSE